MNVSGGILFGEDTDAGGKMAIMWDKMMAAVPFGIKQGTARARGRPTLTFPGRWYIVVNAAA